MRAVSYQLSANHNQPAELPSSSGCPVQNPGVPAETKALRGSPKYWANINSNPFSVKRGLEESPEEKGRDVKARVHKRHSRPPRWLCLLPWLAFPGVKKEGGIKHNVEVSCRTGGILVPAHTTFADSEMNCIGRINNSFHSSAYS